MERSKRTTTAAVIFLAVFHEVGVIGLNLDWSRDIFVQLVPLNLILSAAALAYFHRQWTMNFGIFCFAVFWAGYLVEIVGVQTGLIFGPYHYDIALGPKIGGAPPLIGLNWLILVYISNIISQRLIPNIWLQATIGAALLVMMDVFIEPMAIRFDFWTWDTETMRIPIRNYLAWYVIGWVMSFGFHSLQQEKTNELAGPLYVIQLLFFVSFMVVS